MCIIATVALTHNVLAWAKHRWESFGRLIDGTPLLLIENDKQNTEVMNNESIQQEDIAAMARDCGLKRLNQLAYAVLERNGEISVIQKDKA